MYFDLTNSTVVEPRVGIEFFAAPKTSFGFSYGLHSQILPFPTYYTTLSDTLGNILGQPNTQLGLMRAHHLGISYNQLFEGNMRLRVEPYMQYLLMSLPPRSHKAPIP